MSKKPEINNFHKSLQVLSRKLNMEDYSLVAGTMFQLYTGKKSVQNKAKILNLKVVEGGKNQK